MDLIEVIKKSWEEAKEAISNLYSEEVWNAYYANNNTAKLLFVIPFLSGDIQAARVGYATIVLLWAAKKAKNFSEMKTPGDFHGRIDLLPVFYGTENHIRNLGKTLVKYRGSLDLFHDIESGKYVSKSIMGELTASDARSNVESIEKSIDVGSDTYTKYEAAMIALDGDVAAPSTYKATSDGTIVATQGNLW